MRASHTPAELSETERADGFSLTADFCRSQLCTVLHGHAFLGIDQRSANRVQFCDDAPQDVTTMATAAGFVLTVGRKNVRLKVHLA